jgi:hypothetical protein
MTNILQLQQDIITLNERVNREIQFGEDALRELTATVDLMAETLGHLKAQITRTFNDRNAGLLATIGQPVKPPTVDMTILPSIAEVKGVTAEAAE